MILSNNPRTFIIIAVYHKEYGAGIYPGTGIYKKYMYRWAGPSAVHTSELRVALWDIRNLRRLYDLKQ